MLVSWTQLSLLGLFLAEGGDPVGSEQRSHIPTGWFRPCSEPREPSSVLIRSSTTRGSSTLASFSPHALPLLRVLYRSCPNRSLSDKDLRSGLEMMPEASSRLVSSIRYFLSHGTDGERLRGNRAMGVGGRVTSWRAGLDESAGVCHGQMLAPSTAALRRFGRRPCLWVTRWTYR